MTPAIANLIRENKTYRITSDIQTGKKHGMRLMDDSLFDLWKQGLIEKDDAIRKSIKPNEVRQRIEHAEEGLGDDDDEEEEEEWEEEEVTRPKMKRPNPPPKK